MKVVDIYLKFPYHSNHFNWTSIAQDIIKILRDAQSKIKSICADFNLRFANPNERQTRSIWKA